MSLINQNILITLNGLATNHTVPTRHNSCAGINLGNKPDLIIETGIAHGGSLILYASILELIGNGEVVGIDIDIRSHNKIEVKLIQCTKE